MALVLASGHPSDSPLYRQGTAHNASTGRRWHTWQRESWDGSVLSQPGGIVKMCIDCGQRDNSWKVANPTPWLSQVLRRILNPASVAMH